MWCAVRRGQPASQQRLGRRQPPDRHPGHVVWMLGGELGVQLLVVLAVVADQQPTHPRELRGEPAQRVSFVLPAAAKPRVGGRSPVGEQQRPGREQVPGQKPGQRRRHVPGAGGQVEHRCTGMAGGQPLVQHGHARHRGTGMLDEHERVPRREQGPGQRGDHHRVVHVGQDAEPHLRVDHPDGRRHRCGTGALQQHLVPAGAQLRVDAQVDEAAAVGQRLDPPIAGHDRHRNTLGRHRREAAPAAHLAMLGARPGRARICRAQQHPADDPRPAGRAVSGVRHDHGAPAALPQPPLGDRAHRVRHPRGAMHGRLVGTRRHLANPATSIVVFIGTRSVSPHYRSLSHSAENVTARRRRCTVSNRTCSATGARSR